MNIQRQPTRHHERGQQRRGDGRPERGGAVPYPGRQAAAAHVVPVAHDPHGAREHRRLAQAQERSGEDELPEARDEARRRLRHGPDHEAGAQHAARPQPVEQRPARQLGEGVGPQEGGEQQAHVGDRQAELLADQRVGDRERGTVDVVQRAGEDEQDERGSLCARDAWRRHGRGHPCRRRHRAQSGVGTARSRRSPNGKGGRQVPRTAPVRRGVPPGRPAAGRRRTGRGPRHHPGPPRRAYPR